MINTAIDHYRKFKKHVLNGHEDPVTLQVASTIETPLDKMTYDELLKLVQQLSPGYRTVFNLFVIEGMSHEEISKRLGIAEGTSKSNLAKARMHLQKLIIKKTDLIYNKNVAG